MTDAAELPPETAPRQAPIALWRFARTLIFDLHGLFGAPEDIAQSGYVARAAYKLMLQWIGGAEAFMRRLLSIEAQAILNAGELAPAKPHARTAPRTKRLISFHPDQPDQWRVSFRCFSGNGDVAPRQAQGDAKAADSSVSLSLSKAGTRAPTVYDAWPLALRCEALRRVFNDPIPYARRLARRLRAQPTLSPRAASPTLQRIVGGAEHWLETEALCTVASRPRPRAVDSS